MFQTSVLASGSKGNSILIRTEKTTFLLDAGLSGIKIINAMNKIGVSGESLHAVLVSHEHTDHILGVGILARKYRIPIYISGITYPICKGRLGKLPQDAQFFNNGETFSIGDISITPFSSSHDVVDGSNFIFQKLNDSTRKLAIATDLGFSSNLLITKLKNSSTIILESNHDLEMLLSGPYPWHLKQRIKGRQGHLSNEQAVGVISQIFHSGINNIILAHLSEINNQPVLAYNSMKNYLETIRHDIKLVVSSQYEPTDLIDI